MEVQWHWTTWFWLLTQIVYLDDCERPLVWRPVHTYYNVSQWTWFCPEMLRCPESRHVDPQPCPDLHNSQVSWKPMECLILPNCVVNWSSGTQSVSQLYTQWKTGVFCNMSVAMVTGHVRVTWSTTHILLNFPPELQTMLHYLDTGLLISLGWLGQ